MKFLDLNIGFDVGAACPLIIENEFELYLVFYMAVVDHDFEFPSLREVPSDIHLGVAKFYLPLVHSYGLPNDEMLHVHPYYSLGITRYNAYQVENSDLISDLIIKTEKCGFNTEYLLEKKHYIFTFKEGLFECVSNTMEFKEHFGTRSQLIDEILQAKSFTM